MHRKAEPPKPRPVGRPRTVPEGAKNRGLFLTDEEWAALRPVAESQGVSRLELCRRAVLRAIARAG